MDLKLVDQSAASKVGLMAAPKAATKAAAKARQTAGMWAAPKAVEMDPSLVDLWAACWVGWMVEPWAA